MFLRKKKSTLKSLKDLLRCMGTFLNLSFAFRVSEQGRLGDFLCVFLDKLDSSPIALRGAKVVYSFGLSDCNTVE